LKNKSEKLFNKDIQKVLKNKNNNELDLYSEFKEFEKKLQIEILNAWNNIPGVIEGKEILNILNNKQRRTGTGPTSMAILAKIFPEIKELFFVNWDDVSTQDFANNINFDLYDFKHIASIPNTLDSYLILTTYDSLYYTLQQQIENNTWRVGFDKNDNFAIYTMKGLQLFTPGNKSEIGNYDTYAACNNWYFSNTDNYTEKPDTFSLLNIIQKTKSEIDNKRKMKVVAFMYRKMTNEEIMKYITQ
ncbi:MAG: hypothetical protein IJ848_00970, partial [Alphaproteobacteria bacterium]|nr:hypothetical protein [Alphaproteobacteria bacterium]